jgi:hypothetical protein
MRHLGNNPAVNLENRRWLEHLSRDGVLVDKVSCESLTRIVGNGIKNNPSGLVFELAWATGATRDSAMMAACASELFFAVCSYTDDLQDGDSAAYLPDLSLAVQLNLQAHLFCLLTIRVNELASRPDVSRKTDIVNDLYRAGAAMLTGQRWEIVRDEWNLQVYEDVARRIAGDQYGIHFRLAAFAADSDLEQWHAFGKAYGSLLQLVVDNETGDERLLVLGEVQWRRLLSRLVADLEEASTPLDEMSRKYAKALLRRCPKDT